MSKLSVVLPVFNAERTVARAVRSILNQTFQDFEFIIVDDGSTDGTASVLREIRDARIRVVRTGHVGVAGAANIGTKLSSTPYIARMDADDVCGLDRLEKQFEFLVQNDLDVVGCRVRIRDELGNSVPSLARYERWINEDTVTHDQIYGLRFVELPLVNPTIMARRRYFDIGFRGNGFPEDYDLMLRAAASGMRFGKVKEILLDWYDHPGRLTRNSSRYSDDAFMKCRRNHLIAGPLRGVASVDLWGVGKSGKPWLAWLQQHGIEVRSAFDVDMRKVGQSVRGVRISHTRSLPLADGTPLIIAVGAANARRTILPQARSRGYVAGIDAWFVA